MSRNTCGRINPDECDMCKLPPRVDGVDQCLGKLPMVRNACCGHGEPQSAYVQFSPRLRIAGRTARVYQWALIRLRDLLSPRYGATYHFQDWELREIEEEELTP